MQHEGTTPPTSTDAPGLPPSRKRSWIRLIVLFVVGVVAAAGGGFWTGAYWASHAPSTPRPFPEVLLAKNVAMPAARYTLAQTGAGWGYWDSRYAGLRLEFAYNAPFPIDACLIDLPAVPGPGYSYSYLYCSSQPGSAILNNRSAGVLGFTVPSQRDGGFDFDVLSPRGLGGNVTVAWWINSTSGTTVGSWPSSKIGIPPAQLLAESHVGESVFLPAGYDSLSVQGRSTYPVYVTIGYGYPPYLGAAGPATTWNWTGSIQFPRTYVQVDLYTRSSDPVNASLTVLVFKS
jgi:hypothetical protein